MELWTGGTIYTMTERDATVEAVLVENGKIVALGTREQLEQRADHVYELNGATMYPGFVDSHIHLIGYGELLSKATAADCTTVEQLKAVIKEEAAKRSGEEWLFVDLWDEHHLDRLPTIDELDALYDGPMALRRVCRHVCLTNHAGLRAIGIGNTSFEQNEQVGRDERGELNGLLYENMNDLLVTEATKNVTDEQLEQYVEKAIQQLTAAGITGVHSEDLGYFGHYSKSLRAYKKVIGKNTPFRAHLLRNHRVFQQMIDDSVTVDGEYLQFGAMKLFADGSFGGNTAWVKDAYVGTETTGIAIHTEAEFEKWVQLARKYDSGIAVHAIGDAAVDQLIRHLENVPQVTMRDRYIHGSLCSIEQMRALRNLNVIVDAQPTFLLSDMPWLQDKLGQRDALLYAWNTFLKEGLVLGAGTDAPIENISPFEVIWAGVTRKKPSTNHVFHADERLTRYEMVHMYTAGSAYTGNQEMYRGKIEEGFDADFTILDTDLLRCEEEAILKANVRQTVVDGKVVYSSKL